MTCAPWWQRSGGLRRCSELDVFKCKDKLLTSIVAVGEGDLNHGKTDAEGVLPTMLNGRSAPPPAGPRTRDIATRTSLVSTQSQGQ